MSEHCLHGDCDDATPCRCRCATCTAHTARFLLASLAEERKDAEKWWARAVDNWHMGALAMRVGLAECERLRAELATARATALADVRRGLTELGADVPGDVAEIVALVADQNVQAQRSGRVDALREAAELARAHGAISLHYALLTLAAEVKP